MNQSSNMTNVIKGMIKNSLDSYIKILPSSQINIDDLMRKTEEINAKLNPRRPKDALKGQMSLNEKSVELTNKKISEYNYVDTEAHRLTDNKYIPRLRINQIQEMEIEKNKEAATYSGIMSLYTVKDYNPKKSNLKIDNKELSFRMVKEEDTNPNQKPNCSFNSIFVLNEYIEYTYHDEDEKLFDDNDLLRNAFEKNMQKNLLSSLNLTKKDSLFMQSYDEILKKASQIENITKQELSLCYQHEEAENDDDIKYETNKEILERNRQHAFLKPDILMESFKSYFHDQVNQYKTKKSQFPLQEQVNFSNQFIKKINQYTYNDISFGFCIVSGLISYPNIIPWKASEIQILELHGPYLIIYDKEDNTEIDVSFDLRNYEKELDTLIAEPSPHKLNGEVLLNDNGIKKTINSLTLFNQIASYFNSLKTNISNPASYNTLKYLTDSSITHLDLYSNYLLNIIQWHNSLTSLTIRYDLIKDLLTVIDNKWTLPMSLETLTVKKVELNDESNYDNDFYELFSKECSIYIRNIHLININYSETIHSALLQHIEQFYYTQGNKRLNDSIPILNLSIIKAKKSTNTAHAVYNNYQQNTESQKDDINLNMIYSVFIVMLYHMIECNNLFPLSFNRLDLSNQSCYNVQGLVKIITKFKMIKELDITNVKVNGGEYLIDSIHFLPYIRITNKVISDIKFTNDSEYESEYRNEFKALKENNYNNAKEETDDIGYDLSFGIYPILEKVIFDNTSHPQETIHQLFNLFKRLKFFQGFPIPHVKDKKIDDDVIPNIIKDDIDAYCENIFELEQDYYNIH